MSNNAMPPASARSLHTGYPELSSAYNDTMMKYYMDHRIVEWIGALHETFTTISRDEVRRLLIQWDNYKGWARMQCGESCLWIPPINVHGHQHCETLHWFDDTGNFGCDNLKNCITTPGPSYADNNRSKHMTNPSCFHIWVNACRWTSFARNWTEQIELFVISKKRLLRCGWKRTKIMRIQLRRHTRNARPSSSETRLMVRPFVRLFATLGRSSNLHSLWVSPNCWFLDLVTHSLLQLRLIVFYKKRLLRTWFGTLLLTAVRILNVIFLTIIASPSGLRPSLLVEAASSSMTLLPSLVFLPHPRISWQAKYLPRTWWWRSNARILRAFYYSTATPPKRWHPSWYYRCWHSERISNMVWVYINIPLQPSSRVDSASNAAELFRQVSQYVDQAWHCRSSLE